MISINSKAPVQCRKSITIRSNRNTVWEVLTQISAWSDWQTTIKKAKLHGDLKPETIFTWKSGGVSITSTLKTVKPCSDFSWTGKTFGIFAIHTWKLSESNGITLVEVEESMDGILAIIFRNTFQKKLEQDMQFWLESLKQACEAK